MNFFCNIFKPTKLSPKSPVTYISSFSFALFLKTILLENPIDVIVKLNFFEKSCVTTTKID